MATAPGLSVQTSEPQRQMQLHIGGDVEYFYCSECNWVRTLAGVRDEAGREVFRRDVAGPAFVAHVCSDYPRSIKGVMGRPLPTASLADEFRLKLDELRRFSMWDIGLGIAAGVSLLTMLLTAVLGARQFRVDVAAPAPMFFAALTLLLLMSWLVLDRTRNSYVNFFRMIGEMLHRSQAQEEARRDPLTGTYNRAALHEFGEVFLSHAHRSRQPLTLVIADLDHFGELNHQFGHMAGDSAIAEFAQLLIQATRGSDIVARYGGDEFVLLLHETPSGGGESVIDRICRQLQSRNQSLSKEQVPVSFTAGLAVFERGMGFPDLFAKADVDLLRRKSQRGSPS